MTYCISTKSFQNRILEQQKIKLSKQKLQKYFCIRGKVTTENRTLKARIKMQNGVQRQETKANIVIRKTNMQIVAGSSHGHESIVWCERMSINGELHNFVTIDMFSR